LSNDYLGWIFQSLIINYHSSAIISKLPRATEQYFQSQEYTGFTTASQRFLQKNMSAQRISPQKRIKTEEKTTLENDI
jgi:hypothetical protein